MIHEYCTILAHEFSKLIIFAVRIFIELVGASNRYIIKHSDYHSEGCFTERLGFFLQLSSCHVSSIVRSL